MFQIFNKILHFKICFFVFCFFFLSVYLSFSISFFIFRFLFLFPKMFAFYKFCSFLWKMFLFSNFVRKFQYLFALFQKMFGNSKNVHLSKFCSQTKSYLFYKKFPYIKNLFRNSKKCSHV